MYLGSRDPALYPLELMRLILAEAISAPTPDRELVVDLEILSDIELRTGRPLADGLPGCAGAVARRQRRPGRDSDGGRPPEAVIHPQLSRQLVPSAPTTAETGAEGSASRV